MRPLPLVIALLFAAGPMRAMPAQSAAPLADLLAKAGAYVQRFEAEFSSVVCEEDYDQHMAPSGIGQRYALDRKLRSDFTLVQAPGSTEWLPYRDVFEVDGRPLRDREDRLSKLFLTPTPQALNRARAIMEESARYNVGGLNRTINVPVLAFEVIRPGAQQRFRFATAKRDKSTADGVDVVAFREVGRPSFIHGPTGGDLPSTGRLWIARDTGEIMKTELIVDTSLVTAVITTTFGDQAGFTIAVPLEMREEYTNRGKPVVVGRARYTNFRKFGVEVTETKG